MNHHFDELAKDLARGLSRREALRRIGGMAGALLASVGLRKAWGQGNSDCAHFCNSIYPPGDQRGQCKNDAAHGTGICYECGPASTTGQVLCIGDGGPVCCAAGQGCCGGQCLNLGTSENCSGCGDVCTGGLICQGNPPRCSCPAADVCAAASTAPASCCTGGTTCCPATTLAHPAVYNGCCPPGTTCYPNVPNNQGGIGGCVSNQSAQALGQATGAIGKTTHLAAAPAAATPPTRGAGRRGLSA